MSSITTNFSNNKAFWEDLDKAIGTYQNQLNSVAQEKEKVIDNSAKQTQSILQNKNQQAEIDNKNRSQEIVDLVKEYKTSAAKNKSDAEKLLSDTERAANMEANITAAKANQWGKLSVWQLASINKDITNQFQSSINEARGNMINFNTALDDKLLNLGFSANEKQKMIDALNKELNDEEAQPLIDAIATKSTTRQEFIGELANIIKTINTTKITESTDRGLREDRLIAENEAWNKMDSTMRWNYLRDKFWATWNVLSEGQKNELIQKAISGAVSLSEINALIKNYTDKAEQQKIIAQSALAYLPEETGQSILDETGIQTSLGNTFTKWTISEIDTRKNNAISKIKNLTNLTVTQRSALLKRLQSTNITEADLKSIEDYIKNNTQTTTLNKPTNTINTTTKNTNQVKNTGYTKDGRVYKSKQAYDEMVKSIEANRQKLIKLQKDDPKKYKELVKQLESKYLL